MSAAGDIWSSGAFSFESPLKDLLDSGSYTLEDLLGEDELLQELRALHPQLVTFFCTETIVTGLVQCLLAAPNTLSSLSMINEKNCPRDDSNVGLSVQGDDSSESSPSLSDPTVKEKESNWILQNTTTLINPTDSNEDANKSILSIQDDFNKLYIRYPYIACEVLCCEILSVLDIFVDGTVSYDGFSKLHVNNITESEDNVEEKKHGSEDDELSPHLSQHEREQNQSILDLLFSILFDTAPSKLDDRRAGYLEKILFVLFRRKPVSMTAYINGDHLVNQVIKGMSHCTIDKEATCNGGENTVGSSQKSIHKGGGLPLLKAMFKHLHSYSIMQIVKGLLMPSPPSPPNPEVAENGEEANADIGATDENLMSGDDDDDDDDDCLIGGNDGFIKSDWAESKVTLNLLIDCLVGETIDGRRTHSKGEEEARIDTSHHASEILVAIIQNSPLNSNIIQMMTCNAVVLRLVQCSCGDSFVETGDSEFVTTHTFSMDESIMTNVMIVLESLVLQLGGYGIVPTVTSEKNTNENDVEVNLDKINSRNNEKDQMEREQGSGNSTLTDGLVNDYSSEENAGVTEDLDHLSATITETTFLKEHLPRLLSSLSKLLIHPDTTRWESNVQYSSRPQRLLGLSRLRIVRLLESFVLLGCKEIDHILCQSKCLEICLDLFWEFCWCSMLHQSVANLLVHVLEGGVDRIELQYYFLYRCDLLRKLINSFAKVSSSSNVKIEGLDSELPDNDVEDCLTGQHNSDAVFAMKNYRRSDSGSSEETEADSSEEEPEMVIGDHANEDVIPVSDDDVDAAMEQEVQFNIVNQNNKDTAGLMQTVEGEESDKTDQTYVANESRNQINHDENNKVDSKAPIVEGSDQEKITTDGNYEQSPIASGIKPGQEDSPLPNVDGATSCKSSSWKALFRMGNMGHVIILCEALVHACGIHNPNSGQSEEIKEIDLEEGISNLKEFTSHTREIKDDGDSSRKRKDHPPTSASDDEEDIEKRKVPSDDSSIVKDDKENMSRAFSENIPISSPLIENFEGVNILSLVQKHPLYLQWQSFITTTVSVEKAKQTTPLGGLNTQKEENIDIQSPNALIDTNASEGLNGILINSEEIDMDVAASMMAALNPPSGATNSGEEDSLGGRHHRQKGVIAGQGSGDNGTGFGTVVQMHQNPGEYLYNDPLGGCQSFDETGDEDEDAFGSTSYTADCDHETEYSDSPDEDDVPVIDLFAGNFTDFEDSKVQDDSENDDSGWANFNNFEETFVTATNDPVELSTSEFTSNLNDAGEDLFAVANAADIIDESTDLFGTAESLSSEDLFGNNSMNGINMGNSAKIATKIEVTEALP